MDGRNEKKLVSAMEALATGVKALGDTADKIERNTRSKVRVTNHPYLEPSRPPAREVVKAVPVVMMGTEELLGSAEITADDKVMFTLDGGELASIVRNLTQLNQIAGFHLGLQYLPAEPTDRPLLPAGPDTGDTTG